MKASEAMLVVVLIPHNSLLSEFGGDDSDENPRFRVPMIDTMSGLTLIRHRVKQRTR